MKNVGYAWKIAQGWSCPAVGTQCATIASMTGSPNSHLHCQCFYKVLSISPYLDCSWNISNIMCLILNCRNVRSQSCPFCRGSLKRVSSRDLWELISNSGMIDTITLARENLMRFYLYIENLPVVMPDTHLFVYDYML